MLTDLRGTGAGSGAQSDLVGQIRHRSSAEVAPHPAFRAVSFERSCDNLVVSAEDVLSRVRDLVNAGEYLDSIPGVAGTNLQGGGMFKLDAQGVRQRMYDRGTPEFTEAKRQGLVENLPPLSVATEAEVEEAERLLGCPLPVLLRRLYLEVGNGGFGPGYGLLGLRHGHRDDSRRTAVDLYEVSEQWWPTAPEGLLPICHWGCAIYSLVKCPSGEMWGYDPNPPPREELDQALFPQEITLADWFERWVQSRLFQPCLTKDEVTGLWRGATDEEIAGWVAMDT